MVLLVAVMFTSMAPALARIAGADTLENDSTMSLSTDTLGYDDPRRFDEFFLEAVRQKQKGSTDSAFALLRHCLELDSTAAEAYFACVPFYKQQGNDSLSLDCLMKAARLAPSNDTYQEYVARHYIENGDYDKAITAYENLYSNHRDRSDVLEILFQLYYRKKDYTNTLKTLDRLEQIDGSSEELSLLKMNVYEQRGDSKMAHQVLQGLVDSHPNESTYKVMLGNWLLNHDRRDEAFAMFQGALNDDSNNEFAQMSLYDYYRAAGNDSAANAVRDNLLLSPKTADKTKMSMLQQYIKESEQQGGDSVPVLKLFDRVMEANPKNSSIAYLKVLYMHLKSMPAASVIEACRRVLQIEPEMSAARLDMLQIQITAGDWDAVISTSTEGIQYDPTNVVNYYFLGVGRYQKDDDDAALDALRREMNEATSESYPNIVSDGYALMGDILYKKHRTDEAFAALDSCLQWKEDNISALNNYAYYLSEENRDLDKAETMSRKTVEAEPNNATYLDTYAWILFKKGRYSEAKAYIDRALENSTSATSTVNDSLKEDSLDTIPANGENALSDVVLEHAGDIYFNCGETDRAVELWQEATRYGDGSATLPKKIKQRKYIPAK
jgi:tetratricopeptide (TPR) repeat protein